MEVPILSQDVFFRHLNLVSVHANSAKYQYRQTLKERLRARTQTKSLTPPSTKNESKKEVIETKSPIVSPVKWLTPRKRRKMFGRPKIRAEHRKIIDFDNNKLKVIKEESNNNSNQRLLESLLSNCHVLRHPGIRKEVEASVNCGPSRNFDVKDEFWNPPTTSIIIRKCYWKKPEPAEKTAASENNNSTSLQLVIGEYSESLSPKNNNVKNINLKKSQQPNNPKSSQLLHETHVRIQPGIQNPKERTKKERRVSAALALYHLYKPKARNGSILSLRDFTQVFFRNGQKPWARDLLNQKSRCVNEDPLNGSNWYKNGLTVPMKKLTNTQLKAKKIPSVYPESKQQQPAVGTKPEMTIEPEVVPEVEEKTVKTSYGRQSKPVLVPIKTENVRCKHCQELFRSLYKLKQHMEKVHSDQLPEKLQSCQKVLPLGYVPAPLHEPLNGFLKFKCDICNRKFEKRTRMIRHIKNMHSSDIHRVDLSKFVLPKKFQQRHPWSLIEL